MTRGGRPDRRGGLVTGGAALAGLGSTSALGPLPPAGVHGEPAQVTAVRRAAAAWLASEGFPTQKHEDWRYTDLRPLLALPFVPATGANDTATVAALLPRDLGGPRLVFANGRLLPRLSRCDGLPGGVTVTPLSSALHAGDRQLERLWCPPAAGWRDGFEALNVAVAGEGALIELADGVTLDAPIELVFVTVADDRLPLASYRGAVIAGAPSRATVVETHLGTGTGPSMTNARTLVSAGVGARLDHYRLQAEAPQACHLSSLDVRLSTSSRVDATLVALGASLGRHETHAVVAGEGAAVELHGLYLPARSQCHDNPVLVEHVAPGGTSRQRYKGIVDGAGHGIFNGHVVVHPGASGSDARQTNKNLLLSDRAEVDTRPRLEIFADDVACTHGAAVGQLDADALFYLRSRGIHAAAARAMLAAGFAEEILARFSLPEVRARADRLVAAHLGAGVVERVER